MICTIDWTAAGTWAGVAISLCFTIGGALWASYTGSLRGTKKSIRGVRRALRMQNETAEKNHEENKASIVKIVTRIDSLDQDVKRLKEDRK